MDQLKMIHVMSPTPKHTERGRMHTAQTRIVPDDSGLRRLFIEL